MRCSIVGFVALLASFTAESGCSSSGNPTSTGGAPVQSGGAAGGASGGSTTGGRATGGRAETGGTGSGGQGTGGASKDTTCSSVLNGDVKVSEPSGTFQGTLAVRLSTTVSGAQIRYTTDGTAPTASSSLYSDALALTKTTRLRASAFVNGAATGAPSGALFVARTIDATHDLPVIVLDSYGSGKLPTSGERPFVDVGFLSFGLTGGAAKLSATPTSASFAAFHVRGNSSALADKTPYRLELRDQDGEDRDCQMLGMPADSDWALVGPHADKTLIHNNFVYGLAKELGLQASRITLAEVYVAVDGKPLADANYQGVYQVVETIKDSKNRLDLKQLDETKTAENQLSGGYIFSFEWMITPESPLPCPSTAANCWQAMEVIDPEPIVDVQKAWLTNHLVSFNNALHGPSIADPASGYPSFIEPRSFIDTVILNELTRNLDAYVRSQYFFKDRGEKINAGPIWDFDVIAGVGVSATGGFGGIKSPLANTTADGWQYEANASRLTGQTADWFPLLLAEPGFKAQLVSRWKELRRGLLADAALATRIDGLTAGLANAATRNFKKWNILTQDLVNPFNTPTAPTWAEQIAFMKTWLQQRAAWIDGQWK